MMDTYVSLLQTYAGRDKIMRTVGYTSMFLTGAVKGRTGQTLTLFARQISAARMVMRLFDDVPMWRMTSKWGAGEKDTLSRALAVLSSVSIQLYYPCEHIAWGADRELWPVESTRWWTATAAWYTLSLFFSILRGIRSIFLLRRKRSELIQQKKMETLENVDDKDSHVKSSLKECAEKEISEYVGLVKNVADFLLAVNTLPVKGFLWSGKFGTVTNATFGVTSSLTGLYLLVKAQQKKAK